MNLLNRLRNILLVFASIFAIGTFGYRAIESWSFLDSFYMAVITVTTVGFSEVQPLSAGGQLFTTALILLGVGGMTYAFSAVTNYIITGELRGHLKERRMKRIVNALSRHYVVCGYGATGKEICAELRKEQCPIVVVDKDSEKVGQAEKEGYVSIQGDAGTDEVLNECGIERAAGLIVATDDDATNLLVVLSARALKDDLHIVARAGSGEATDKLLRAGADRALYPHSIAGRRMAQMVVRPEVCEFLDVVTHDEALELVLENLTVGKGSLLDGKTIGETKIRETTGAHVVGLKRAGEGIIPRLASSTLLHSGDILFVLGTRSQLGDLASMVEEVSG